MNKKIYNNLSVENLVKTKWFNQFEIYQQEEILEGLKNNIDVSIYAKPEYNVLQMQEIRLGLQEGLDVSIYAKRKYTVCQMREIREKLLEEASFIYV